MADCHGFLPNNTVAAHASSWSTRDEDFQEEDIWSVVKETSPDSTPNIQDNSSSGWRLQTGPRMIPTTTCPLQPQPVQQASAPVNIPDWSRIYGGNTRTGSWGDGDREDHDHVHGDWYYYNNNNKNVNEKDGEEDEMVPPHEWIAKKLARSQISSFSVCEGIGRTLKGRDLSKVRNAILTKTGFLE